MLMDMCLSKFDIYQGSGVTSYFKSHTNFDVLIFFYEKVLSDVRSEIHLV